MSRDLEKTNSPGATRCRRQHSLCNCSGIVRGSCAEMTTGIQLDQRAAFPARNYLFTRMPAAKIEPRDPLSGVRFKGSLK